MTISIEHSVETHKINIKDLPSDWTRKPYSPSLHDFTLKFLDSERLICEVPSAQSYREHNYLINVRHPNFHSMVQLTDVRPEPFDHRLKI